MNKPFSAFSTVLMAILLFAVFGAEASQSFTSNVIEQIININGDISFEHQFNAGFVIGAAFSFAITLLFFYLANGNKSILFICAYFLVYAYMLSLLMGQNIQILSSEFYQLTNADLPMLLLVADVFLLLFATQIFRLRTDYNEVFKPIAFCALILSIYTCSAFFLPVEVTFITSLCLHVCVNLLLVGATFVLVRRKQRLARLFSIFVILQLIFAVSNAISLMWLTKDIYLNTLYLFGLSYTLYSLSIAFILSRGHYYQIQDKHLAQSQALASAMQSKDAQDELLALQEETQAQLESHVQERTLELNIALQELEFANKELAEKNTRDELTGLYNRRFYEQKIVAEHRRSRRNLTPLSVVVIDIDHFKKVNDTYGHLAGDHCISLVAGKIKASLGRASDIGCRYGGEEFCLILPETDMKGAIALAEEIRNIIENHPIDIQNKQFALTISCGVSTYLQQADILPEDIFSSADRALYQAKNAGRNRVEHQDVTHAKIHQEATYE